ncbi:Transmembrane protein 41A [Chamberlinius hualienensis]
MSKASLLCVPIIIGMSTLWLYLLTVNAPSNNHDDSQHKLHFPSSLDELKQLAATLKFYYENHYFYTVVVFISAYLYKQSFAIPGSVFLNILAGAVFGLFTGFTVVCSLSAIGASCCYLLSKTFCKDLIHKYFFHRLKKLQETIDDNRSNLFGYLLFARLFPMTPNWFLNIASPIFNIPLAKFALSVFIGLMPYNFICVQTGVVLSQINSLDDVFTYNVLFKLLLIACVALVPNFILKKLRPSSNKLN